MLPLRFVLLSAFTGFIAALPFGDSSQKTLESRCGGFQPWDSLFILDENRPDDYIPISDYLFQVYQNAGVNGGKRTTGRSKCPLSLALTYSAGRATGRRYLLVHFPPTPYGTYGCELHWNIPANTQFLNYTGSHQLDVKQTTAYFPPFRPTWNSVIAGNPPTLGGVFGTVNAVADVSSVVNTATCSNGPPAGAVGGGFGLGFVFKFADWIEQSGNPAAVSFYGGFTGPAGVFKGPYLNYNC